MANDILKQEGLLDNMYSPIIQYFKHHNIPYIDNTVDNMGNINKYEQFMKDIHTIHHAKTNIIIGSSGAFVLSCFIGEIINYASSSVHFFTSWFHNTKTNHIFEHYDQFLKIIQSL